MLLLKNLPLKAPLPSLTRVGFLRANGSGDQVSKVSLNNYCLGGAATGALSMMDLS
jgi:hypothetical protein